MARGWESKSVEEQIAEKEEKDAQSPGSRLSRKQVAQREKRDGLMLVRSRAATDLESARDPRYRALLERTIAHLDAQLSELDLAS